MEICFKVNETGTIVTRVIYNYEKAKAFVRKLEHSKKCTLISCFSLFD